MSLDNTDASSVKSSCSENGPNTYKKPDNETWNRIIPGLQEKLEKSPEFLGKLVAGKVITSEEKETIEGKDKANANSQLIRIISNRNEEQYQNFIKALQETYQGGVLGTLGVAFPCAGQQEDRNRSGTDPEKIELVIMRIKDEYGQSGPVEDYTDGLGSIYLTTPKDVNSSIEVTTSADVTPPEDITSTPDVTAPANNPPPAYDTLSADVTSSEYVKPPSYDASCTDVTSPTYHAPSKSAPSIDCASSTDSISIYEKYILLDVYVDPKIKETFRKQKGFKKTIYDTSERANLLEIVCSNKVRTLLEGIQLIGKSALMKMTRYRWAIGQQGTDIPLLIYIDHTHEAEDFKSTLDKALYFIDDEEKQSIRKYQNTNPGDVMYVIDGIDHFKKSKTREEILKLFCGSKSHILLSYRTNQPLVSEFRDYASRILEIQKLASDRAKTFVEKYREAVFTDDNLSTYQQLSQHKVIPGVCKYQCNFLHKHLNDDKKMQKVAVEIIYFLLQRENEFYLHQDKNANHEAFKKLCQKACLKDKESVGISVEWVTSEKILETAARVFLVRKASRLGFHWLYKDLHKILDKMGRRFAGKRNPFHRLCCCCCPDEDNYPV